jgi:hypothetical protein
MGDANEVISDILDVEIGLLVNATGKYIPLEHNEGISFATASRVKTETDFKIEITNSLECFTYIFGEETDGSSYVLFPYTKKHSPYCGITGTRVFPKDYSLYPDEQGERDFIAIVISRQKLDYNLLNEAINSASGNTYDQKVYTALEDELVRDINFADGNTVRFSTGNSGRNAVAMVMEIIK